LGQSVFSFDLVDFVLCEGFLNFSRSVQARLDVRWTVTSAARTNYDQPFDCTKGSRKLSCCFAPRKSLFYSQFCFINYRGCEVWKSAVESLLFGQDRWGEKRNLVTVKNPLTTMEYGQGANRNGILGDGAGERECGA
jgi:hypothetical protein